MEKRRFPRKSVSLDVECETDEDQSTKIAAKAVDISRGGIGLKQHYIGLKMDKPIQEGGIVNITIHRPSWKVDRIKGKGKVIWINKMPTGEYRMGVEFTVIAWTAFGEFFDEL